MTEAASRRIFGWRHIKPRWIATAAICAALLLLPSTFALNGKPHADWQQFLGRFHPLAVHLPIGFILLLPIFEIAGRFRPALREAAAFVLVLSVLSCFAAVILGYLLAYGSGAAGAGVTRHMWGGISLTIGVMVCLLLRPAWIAGTPLLYPAALIFVLGLLSWAAHQGGSITHGENYLFQYMNPSLRRWLHLDATNTTAIPPDAVYALRIQPMLENNCVTCHGEGKVKGGLRLDTYDWLMKGGQAGPAVEAGLPDRSLLLQRVTLPTDDKKFMPSEGKPPLHAEDIRLLRAWIAQGASATATSLTGVAQLATPQQLTQVGDYANLRAQMAEVEKATGVKLLPISSKPGDGLALTTIDASGKFTDANLAAFTKFGPYIVEADLGRSGVTDAAFGTLAQFSHLRALHLEDTAVTGSGLAKLVPLQDLTYLNLSDTKVTQAAIAPLASIKTLQHIYLYNTPAQPAPSAHQATPAKESHETAK